MLWSPSTDETAWPTSTTHLCLLLSIHQEVVCHSGTTCSLVPLAVLLCIWPLMGRYGGRRGNDKWALVELVSAGAGCREKFSSVQTSWLSLRFSINQSICLNCIFNVWWKLTESQFNLRPHLHWHKLLAANSLHVHSHEYSRECKWGVTPVPN